MNSVETLDVLILGAGAAGLAAAQSLQAAGRSPLVLDKGRSIGGRLSNRRIGDAVMDHGAQFFTARDPKFKAQVEQWLRRGVIREWYSDVPGKDESHPRYFGIPAMTAIAHDLSVGFAPITSTRVTGIRREPDQWRVLTEDTEYSNRILILTAPVPQSLQLLRQGRVELPRPESQILSALRYESCLSVVAVLGAPSGIDYPGAVMPDHADLQWLADNQKKGISNVPAVTIHASPEWSEQYFDAPREESGKALLELAAPWIRAPVIEYQTHGWRYSKPVNPTDQNALAIRWNNGLKLIFAGDAFGGPRVEGAVCSGWAAADLC